MADDKTIYGRLVGEAIIYNIAGMCVFHILIIFNSISKPANLLMANKIGGLHFIMTICCLADINAANVFHYLMENKISLMADHMEKQCCQINPLS